MTKSLLIASDHMKVSALIAIFFFLSQLAFCQNSYISKLSLKSTGYNARSIISLANGDYITREIHSDNNHVTLTKFNSCHQLIWCKRADGAGFSWDYDNGFILTRDQGFFFTQLQNTSLGAYVNCIINRCNGQGNVIWSREIRSDIFNNKLSRWSSIAPSVTEQIDSSIIIGGMADSVGFNDNKLYHSIFLLRIDKNGNLIWSRNLGPFPELYIPTTKIVSFTDKSFCFYCYTDKGPTLLRFDSSGSLLWSKVISGVYSFGLSNIFIDSGEELICSGELKAGGNAFPFLTKISKNGKLIWSYYYSDSTNSMLADNFDGNVTLDNNIVLLNAGIFGSKDNKSYLCKIDLNGQPIWNKYIVSKKPYWYWGANNFHIRTSNDSGFILLGSLVDYNVPGNFSVIMKTDKNSSINCGEKDTTPLVKFKTNITLSNTSLGFRKGYEITDTVIKFQASDNLESILCSDIIYPHAHLPKDTILCTDSTYTLLADSGNTGCHYLWSTGDTTSSIIAKKSGRYWVKVYYGYCSAYDTINVIIYKQYKSPLGKDKGICAYDSIKLQAPDTFAKWYWITPAHNKLNSNGIIAKDSGIYYLAFEGIASCKWVDTFHLSYYPRPKAIAGPDTLLCYNQEYTMQGAGGATYKWTPAKYLSSDTIPNPKAHLPNTQRYALIVHNTQGCVDTSYVNMKVRPALKVKISGDTSITCYGRLVLLNAIGQGGYGPGYKYNWPEDSIVGNNFQKKLFKSAWHRVVLDDGCSEVATDSVYIQVTPKPKAAFIILPGTKVNARVQLNFQNQSANALKYYWSFGAAGAKSNEVSPYYFYSDSGTYKVTLIAYGYNDCSDTAYGQIEVIQGNATIYIPNTFTPNGDSLNEVFDINGTEIKEYTLEIYNRWGERLYTGDKGWDGSYHGTISPEGVYLYTIKVTDNFYKHHFFSGTVHLLK